MTAPNITKTQVIVKQHGPCCVSDTTTGITIWHCDLSSLLELLPHNISHMTPLSAP